MATFIVKIDTDNDAFQGEYPVEEAWREEVGRILRKLAAEVEGGFCFEKNRTLRDLNGNDVGRAVHKEEA